jgi:hypothetical protein
VRAFTEGEVTRLEADEAARQAEEAARQAEVAAGNQAAEEERKAAAAQQASTEEQEGKGEGAAYEEEQDDGDHVDGDEAANDDGQVRDITSSYSCVATNWRVYGDPGGNQCKQALVAAAVHTSSVRTEHTRARAALSAFRLLSREGTFFPSTTLCYPWPHLRPLLECWFPQLALSSGKPPGGGRCDSALPCRSTSAEWSRCGCLGVPLHLQRLPLACVRAKRAQKCSAEHRHACHTSHAQAVSVFRRRRRRRRKGDVESLRSGQTILRPRQFR